MQIRRVKPGDPRREGRGDGELGKGRDGGTDGWEGCDVTYEVGAYGMERVHNTEPERSQVGPTTS